MKLVESGLVSRWKQIVPITASECSKDGHVCNCVAGTSSRCGQRNFICIIINHLVHTLKIVSACAITSSRHTD